MNQHKFELKRALKHAIELELSADPEFDSKNDLSVNQKFEIRASEL